MKPRAHGHLRWLLLLVAGIIGAVWMWVDTHPKQGGWDQRPLEGLGNFGRVPDFSLIERSGRQLMLADLRGKVWIANFIYTACKDTCPLQSAEMAKLQEEFQGQQRVLLVSISVDPERDTAKVLAQYAGRFKANPQRWLFLTGDKKEIFRLAQEGFRLSAVPASDLGQASKEILHSSRFALVDDHAQIRGYYSSNEPEALQRLRQDVKRLVQVDKG